MVDPITRYTEYPDINAYLQVAAVEVDPGPGRARDPITAANPGNYFFHSLLFIDALRGALWWNLFVY